MFFQGMQFFLTWSFFAFLDLNSSHSFFSSASSCICADIIARRSLFSSSHFCSYSHELKSTSEEIVWLERLWMNNILPDGSVLLLPSSFSTVPSLHWFSCALPQNLGVSLSALNTPACLYECFQVLKKGKRIFFYLPGRQFELAGNTFPWNMQ